MFAGRKRKVANDPSSVGRWKAALDDSPNADDSSPAAVGMNPDRSCDTRDSPRNSRGSGSGSRSRSGSGSGSRSRSRSRSGSRSGSRSFSRSRSPPHPADDEGVSEFERASAFAGARRGMVFKLGASGLGYYADHGSEAAAAEAEAGAMRAALREVKEGDAGAAAPADPDAPIVAALASHRRGLTEAEAATEALLREAGRSGGRHLSHEAQKAPHAADPPPVGAQRRGRVANARCLLVGGSAADRPAAAAHRNARRLRDRCWQSGRQGGDGAAATARPVAAEPVGRAGRAAPAAMVKRVIPRLFGARRKGLRGGGSLRLVY